MKAEDIEFAKAEILKATKPTPYGPALPMPWGLLRDAIAEIERQRRLLDKCAEVMECNDPGNYRDIFGA